MARLIQSSSIGGTSNSELRLQNYGYVKFLNISVYLYPNQSSLLSFSGPKIYIYLKNRALIKQSKKYPKIPKNPFPACGTRTGRTLPVLSSNWIDLVSLFFDYHYWDALATMMKDWMWPEQPNFMA